MLIHRRAAAHLVALLALAPLAACDANGNGATPAPTPENAEPNAPAVEQPPANATAADAPDEQPDAPPAPELVTLEEAARFKLAELGLDGQFEADGGQLAIGWRTRIYQVHPRHADGSHGTELVPELGPRHDGFLFALRIVDGRFTGETRSRPEAHPDQYLLGAVQRRPYFQVFPSRTSLDGIDKHLLVDIAVGLDADMNIVRAVHQSLLDACAAQRWTTPVRPGG